MPLHSSSLAPDTALTVPFARLPVRSVLEGRFVRLEPLDPVAHLDGLFAAAAEASIWTWLSYGPFTERDVLARWLEERAFSADPLFFAVCDAAGGEARGMCAWLRIDAANGVIEVGHIWHGSGSQRSSGTTEAIHLLLRHAFDDRGYRRVEWKCDAANARSRAAAERLGFTFEGIFRQHMIVKGRNRNTAWFSLLDRDWPKVKAAHEAWLAAENFDADGRQRRRLGDILQSS